MDSEHGRVRMKVESDRLSGFPDDLIHKILSLIGTKQAFQTSALSSRWRYLWTSMPCLDFSDENVSPDLHKFVTHVLSARNNQTEVYSISFCGNELAKTILDYALSHNVQQLNITCMIETHHPVFRSQSLKNLTLFGCGCDGLPRIPPTWHLPSLTTLYLNCVELYDDNTTDRHAGLFSNCANLKNLTLSECSTDGGFSICHDGLSNLTLENGYDSVNVVTPQLMNLTVTNWSGVHLVSAPALSSLQYNGGDRDIPMKVSADLLHLEKVDVCIPCFRQNKKHTHQIVCLLQQLHSVKSLTLNLELVKLLSSSVAVISHQPSPFTNLKNLKIYPANVTETEGTMSAEVKNYLLDGSRGANFTLVASEEIFAMRNVISAHEFMRELQVLLDEWKENSETNTPHLTQDKAPMNQLDTKMKWQFGERLTRVESYWKGLNEQLEKGSKITSQAIAFLQMIEGVLTKLPASHQAKLQARFSKLCAETDTLVDNMVDHLKTQCDKKPRLYFHELASVSQQSS